MIRPFVSYHQAQVRDRIAALANQHARELAAVRAQIAELRGATHDLAMALCDEAEQNLKALRKELAGCCVALPRLILR